MRRNTIDVVWRYIDRRSDTECWNWSGRTTKPVNGYGYVEIAGQAYVAHRVVFAIVNPGLIELKAPRDKSARQFVLHRCDNRLCCNPAHLFLGNYADNMKDAVSKGRWKATYVCGERHHLAKLTADQAREIRWLATLNLAASEVCILYGVSNETARRTMRGRSYAESRDAS